MLHLGTLPIDPPLFLAPMAGVTDRDFRLIVRRIGGVGLVAMEFIPSKGLVAGERRVKNLLYFEEEERPIAIQIYGSDPEIMAEAARQVEALGADVCDVNMGCPANKVLKGCSGAALMGDLALAERIVAAVRRAVSIPVTVKFRLGLDDKRHSYLELGKICEAQGAAAVAMHARTARQMFGGEPAWEHLARLKQALTIPVIGNGDVRTPDDALRLLRTTGCDGVMIGRGATRNPWIFRQIAARLGRGHFTEPSFEERRALIFGHFRAVVAREDEIMALHKLRTFTRWYSHGLPGGLDLQRRIGALRAPEDFFHTLESFFAGLELAEAA